MRLTIGKVAELTSSNVPTLRYYEEIGLIPQAVRTAGGQRTYSEQDLQRLTFIRRCREFGFSIEQVRELVALTETSGADCSGARELAQSHLDAVRVRLRELQGLESSLQAFVKSCDTQCAGGPATACLIIEDLSASSCPTRCG